MGAPPRGLPFRATWAYILRKTTAGVLEVRLLAGDRRLPVFTLRRSA